MVSFEVESLFTNIPLHRCIDLAVDCIIKGNPGIKLIAADLKRLFTLATAETHSSGVPNRAALQNTRSSVTNSAGWEH